MQKISNNFKMNVDIIIDYRIYLFLKLKIILKYFINRYLLYKHIK